MRAAARLAPVLDTEADTMNATPRDEGPLRAVPQSAEQERDHQVPVRSPSPRSVATERDVQVVAQPARQRHVPSAPEVLQRHRGIRRVEVLAEPEPEQQG